jgi:hypothetical protein
MLRNYLILHENGRYGDRSQGMDAVAAVQSHYDQMDGFCSPPPEDDFEAETWTVKAYEIPADLQRQAADFLEDSDFDSRGIDIARFLALHPEIEASEIAVTYTAERGRTAALSPATPRP